MLTPHSLNIGDWMVWKLKRREDGGIHKHQTIFRVLESERKDGRRYKITEPKADHDDLIIERLADGPPSRSKL